MLIGGFAIDHLFIMPVEGAGPEDGRAFVVARGSHAGGGRADARALHHAGDAGLIEERDQGLADRELGDGGTDIERGIGAEGFRGRAHGLSDRAG